MSAFLLFVCVVFLIQSRNISTLSLPGTPGPRVFPFVIIGLLAFCVILHEGLAIRRLILGKKSDNNDASTEKPKNQEKQDLKKVLLSFVVIFLYVLGIDYLGFYPSTALVVFIVLKFIFESRSWLRTLISTALISGSIYVIFALLFSVRLPRGVLGIF